METFKLDIVGQSADLKMSPTSSKDTGIFLPNELMEFLGWKTGATVSFRVHKEDCVKSAVEILTHLPLYSSKSGRIVTHDSIMDDWMDYSNMIKNFFGISVSRIYDGSPFTISETTNGRNYLYKLEQEGFNLRRFFVAGKTSLYFSKNDSGEVDVRFETKFEYKLDSTHSSEIPFVSTNDTPQDLVQILEALRTKPFLLLAGISGTGKSRVVRELAFKSCPEFLQDEDGTTPGNYCMIEVKPNWHDSSELLGYYSNIVKQYIFTDFVKFLLLARLHKDVPFFVCLDEMNLAPVEQYFAEFLSVLETRKKTGNEVKTGALVKGQYFKRIKSINEYDNVKTDADVYTLLGISMSEDMKAELSQSNDLQEKGLSLPDNVFVIGTVNMDDTTHQFSRKVLDRAMTIEMNGGELDAMFGHSHDLEYLSEENILSLDQFQPRYVNADEVLKAHTEVEKQLKDQLVVKLTAVNGILNGTPFVVSYRVLNELVIFAGNLLDDGKSLDEAVDVAFNQIVLMKILPRIEGDEDMFLVKDQPNRLKQLEELVSGATQAKLEEMNNRLNTGFTRFWP